MRCNPDACGKPRLTTPMVLLLVLSRARYVTRHGTCGCRLLTMLQHPVPFVVAIINATDALFQDSLYAKGKDGGAEVARLLHEELAKKVTDSYPSEDVSSWDIYVTLFFDMQGTASALRLHGFDSHPAESVEFVKAFAQAQPLFQLVNVGSGKGHIDHRARDILRSLLPITQCKHGNDKGCLPLLKLYKRDHTMGSRLTLVETKRAEPCFVDLGIDLVSFPTVFRSYNKTVGLEMHGSDSGEVLPTLADWPVLRATNVERATEPSSQPESLVPLPRPNAALPPGSTEPKQMPVALTSGPYSTSSVGVGQSVGRDVIGLTPANTAPRDFVYLNASGARLDSVLPAPDKAVDYHLSETSRQYGKLCNKYHLVGYCKGESCQYRHGDPLTDAEKIVLMHKARSLACAKKSACRDVNCFRGHQCRFNTRCNFELCRMREFHDMDSDGTYGEAMTFQQRLPCTWMISLLLPLENIILPCIPLGTNRSIPVAADHNEDNNGNEDNDTDAQGRGSKQVKQLESTNPKRRVRRHIICSSSEPSIECRQREAVRPAIAPSSSSIEVMVASTRDGVAATKADDTMQACYFRAPDLDKPQFIASTETLMLGRFVNDLRALNPDPYTTFITTADILDPRWPRPVGSSPLKGYTEAHRRVILSMNIDFSY
nr:hypothetical protein CFP56_65227 [Quercus suber]